MSDRPDVTPPPGVSGRSKIRRPDRHGLRDAFLSIEFLIVSAWWLSLALFNGAVGNDARVYLRATQAWLSGGDPWVTRSGVVVYAAPPLTLLLYAPFAWLPELVFVGLIIVVATAAAVYSLRRLGLPTWWLLYPPLAEGIAVGSPDSIVLALMLMGSPGTGALAVMLKVYAGLPLLLTGRWRALVLFAAAAVVTAPLLPWATFVREWSATSATLAAQAIPGVWAHPLFVPAVVAALAYLGRERAAWMVVNALWPAPQRHYAILALPAMSPALAAISALPLPLAFPIGVVIVALGQAGTGIASRARQRVSTTRHT